MPALQIRQLDEQTHDLLLEEARRQRRSLAQQAAVTLRQALAPGAQSNRSRRRALLREIAWEPTLPWPPTLADPAVLLREDRER